MSSKPATRGGLQELVELAQRCCRERRYSEAVKAAEEVLAEGCSELPLEFVVKAMLVWADALGATGDAAAPQGYSWVVEAVQDPARREALEGAGLEWEITEAHVSLVHATGFCVPHLYTADLLRVLDAGEAYVRRIGRPGWRAELLRVRATLLRDLMRPHEAIAPAEEALALRLGDASGPGPTLATYRRDLGMCLLSAVRYPEAALAFQAVLDDPASLPLDRSYAEEGLACCALETGDVAGAVRHAEEAVRFADEMRSTPPRLRDDLRLKVALNTLIQAHRAAGDLRAIHMAAERKVEVARRRRRDDSLYEALRAAADAALDAGDAARARALLAEAEPLAAALDPDRGRTGLHEEMAERRRRLAALEARPRG